MQSTDLPYDQTDLRDYVRPERDGSQTKQKRLTFYLGKYGPFVEYFDADDFNATAMRARIDQVRQTILELHR
jgi:hypothetical protein